MSGTALAAGFDLVRPAASAVPLRQSGDVDLVGVIPAAT